MPRVVCSAVVVLMAICRLAAADPLTVTSGFVIFTDEPGEFRLTGTGFDLRGSWFPGTVTGTFWYDRCYLCAGGSLVDFGSTTYTFSTDPSAIAGGSVGGVAFDRLFYDAEFTFNGPLVIALTRLNEDGSTVQTGLFAFEGRIAVFQDESFSGRALFSADLRGSGTADVFFGADTDMNASHPFIVNELVYRFEDQTPIPEPATLVLLAAGLGVAVRLKKRGRARRTFPARLSGLADGAPRRDQTRAP